MAIRKVKAAKPVANKNLTWMQKQFLAGRVKTLNSIRDAIKSREAQLARKTLTLEERRSAQREIELLKQERAARGEVTKSLRQIGRPKNRS